MTAYPVQHEIGRNHHYFLSVCSPIFKCVLTAACWHFLIPFRSASVYIVPFLFLQLSAQTDSTDEIINDISVFLHNHKTFSRNIFFLYSLIMAAHGKMHLSTATHQLKISHTHQRNMNLLQFFLFHFTLSL